MSNIKAIAFDLGWVLLRENDYPLSDTEKVLEKQFWNINTNEEYYKRAIKTTQLSKEHIQKLIENIVVNIYELRDPDIFDKLPKIKLAIATNQLSYINKRIDKMNIREKFDCILISGDIGLEKPNKKFYTKLVESLKELPEDILFVDDTLENIQWAIQSGLSVLHYDNSKNLTKELQSIINSHINLN